METNNEFVDNIYQQSVNAGESQTPDSVYADLMREDKVRNIISQINPDLLLEDIEHRIRGEIKDRFTLEWRPISKQHKPISEILIGNYISFLGAILTQNTSLSNFKGSEINNLMGMIIDYIISDLTDNDELYGFVKTTTFKVTKKVKKLIPYYNDENMIVYYEHEIPIETEIEIERLVDYNEMTRIANIICISSFAVFKRAENGMEARRIFQGLKISESNQGGMPQKKGFWDILKFGN